MQVGKAFPTYIGNDIGLPHSQSTGVDNPCIVIGKLTDHVVWTEENELLNLLYANMEEEVLNEKNA